MVSSQNRAQMAGERRNLHVPATGVLSCEKPPQAARCGDPPSNAAKTRYRRTITDNAWNKILESNESASESAVRPIRIRGNPG
jgi:hypothetical protein